MLEAIIQKILFLFNPEVAHRLGLALIRLRYSAWCAPKTHKITQKPINLFGLDFPNPIGMAAGWDKDAVCFDALFRMGFGFVEVGTVTPKAQPGNPKPRLFRIKKQQALINRMGFNNLGIDALVEKIRVRKAPGILGVNIGKNKETSLQNAIDDYQVCLKAVFPYTDFVTINISSPNTPDLRKLQSQDYLNNLLRELNTTRKQLSGQYQKHLPLLVKTTVDLPISDYESFVNTLIDNQIDGIIISNTTVNHHFKEAGGLSGRPLREATTKMIQAISALSQSKLPIVGVGGILNAKDAAAHTQAGAQLLQIFTGFVYCGPKLLNQLLLL